MKATRRQTVDQAQQLREAQEFLARAEADGWTLRPGANESVLVAERGSAKRYGRDEVDLARVMRLEVERQARLDKQAAQTDE